MSKGLASLSAFGLFICAHHMRRQEKTGKRSSNCNADGQYLQTGNLAKADTAVRHQIFQMRLPKSDDPLNKCVKSILVS